MSNPQVILHHYPQSPVTEKVRVVLGMKGLTWQSVIIPRLPPKPNLMPLTGGYRLTPVMQIGADVYCDTKCIIRELERRFPDPTLFPDGDEGRAWGMAQWTDGPLFNDVVTVALVEMSPNMPPEFLADRGPLYFGADFSLDGIKAKYLEALSNVRTQFSWFDTSLQSREFLAGSTPGLADALAYYLVWFLRDRMAEGADFFAQFKALEDWSTRMEAIGHGTVHEMSDLDALDIAKKANPEGVSQMVEGDPQGLSVGDQVSVEPVTGGPQVTGALHSLSLDDVALLREDEQIGQICVHFPRLGYSISKA